ncbi:sulfurtransferase TusA family protein [Corynebacterium phocae]|uniref:sulfurtransferase TusA family protein n=1 Tax=Corynebacterium phocae TaxID=161895 RepID=UPI000951F4CB
MCPFPLIEAKQAIAQLKPGDSLVIDFDCPQVTDSIPTSAADEGHVISDFQRVSDAGWQVTVAKTQNELKVPLVLAGQPDRQHGAMRASGASALPVH